jgi:hypothetical protein
MRQKPWPNGIAAERSRPMLRVDEDLLLDGARSDGAFPSFGQVFDVNVQVHRRPMALVATNVLRSR